MRKNTKKAQMITFDLSTSLIIFIIFIAIFIGLFLMAQKPTEKPEFELEYMFSNLENNLRYDGVSGRDFIRDYRVNYLRLNNFASSIDDIDPYVLGSIGDAHGIGLDEEAYDACMYFTDNNNQMISLSGKDAIGMLKGGVQCSSIIPDDNPCDDYKKAYALFKPVLLLQGNPDQNSIILMNIVVCKK